MPRLIAIWVVLTVVVVTNVATAEDMQNPTGTWTWRVINQSAVHTLQLKLEGGKLTGSIRNYAKDRESPIEDAEYKDGIVSFKHTYVGRGNAAKSVAAYKGEVSGDIINGTIEIKHPDGTLSRDWDAKRTK